MNAFNTVNLAAACVLTSIEYAKKLGIPQSRWIYPLGGAGTSESADCRSLIKLFIPSVPINLIEQFGNVRITTQAQRYRDLLTRRWLLRI